MRHALALTALLLAGTAAAQDRFQRGTTPWDGMIAPRDDTLMQSTLLAVHNGARQAHGSGPLQWDAALAEDATRHARALSMRGQMAHDPQTGVETRQGENLFMGTSGAYSYAEMAKLWVDERRWFRKGVFPDVATGGDWSRVGHYTQIVWPETQRVGCALASNGRDDVLVCRYLPAGNYVGVPLD